MKDRFPEMAFFLPSSTTVGLAKKQIPTGIVIWRLKRYTSNENLWDRVCFRCKRVTPVFEYEHRDEQNVQSLAISTKYLGRRSLRSGCNVPRVPTMCILAIRQTLIPPPSSMNRKTMGKVCC